MPAEGVELLPLPLGEANVEVSLLDLDRLADMDSMVGRFLTDRERQEYAHLQLPSRRREWLGARVCLKTMLLRRGAIADPIECELVKDTRGRPSLAFAPGLRAHGVHDCSLSHKGRFACAATSSLMGTRIGVDIEEVSPRLLRLADTFARDPHLSLRARPAPERLTLLWALKEARAKALGGGLGLVFERVIFEEIADGQHRVTTCDAPAIRARHVLHEGYMIALCVAADELCATRRP